MNGDRHAILIVGGGIAGLVTAKNLAKIGLKILLVEQKHFLGGYTLSDEFKINKKGILDIRLYFNIVIFIILYFLNIIKNIFKFKKQFPYNYNDNYL